MQDLYVLNTDGHSSYFISLQYSITVMYYLI